MEQLIGFFQKFKIPAGHESESESENELQRWSTWCSAEEHSLDYNFAGETHQFSLMSSAKNAKNREKTRKTRDFIQIILGVNDRR